MLRDRILPPPDLRSNSLPTPSELPKELAKQETRPHARLSFEPLVGDAEGEVEK
jgi:hypothetical protein